MVSEKNMCEYTYNDNSPILVATLAERSKCQPWTLVLFIVIVINSSCSLWSWCGLYMASTVTFGPRHEKTCLQWFRHTETQTSQLSYRDYLDYWNFACSKWNLYTYTCQNASNKDADQTAQSGLHLYCLHTTRFLASRPIYNTVTISSLAQ